MSMLKKFCSLCSLKLKSENDVKLHYCGKKHQKAMEADELRRNLEKRSVFLFGSNNLTKDSILEYFNSNFGQVSEVHMKEGKTSSAIVEFNSEETARKVLLVKKHRISDQGVVAKPRIIPIKPISAMEDASDKNNSIGHDELEKFFDTFDFENVDQLLNLHQTLKLEESEIQKRIAAVEELKEILKVFIEPVFDLKIYGSTVNGFGWKNSDLDLTLVFHDISSSLPSFGKSCRTVEVLQNCKVEEFRNDGRLLHEEIKVQYTFKTIKKFCTVTDKNFNFLINILVARPLRTVENFAENFVN